MKNFAHQDRALELMKGRTAYALLMEMGTGKSRVALQDLTRLYKEGQIEAAVILAPKGVYNNWVNIEIPKHLDTTDVPRTIKWPVKVANQLWAMTPTPTMTILVMNIEALSSSDKAYLFLMQFLESYKCCMIIDESTTIKSPSANRTKSVVKLGKLAPYRRILTGSPVTRSPLDLFTQFEFLDPRIFGLRSFFAFRNRYAILKQMVLGGRAFKTVVGYQNTEELAEKIKPYSFRILKEECLDLPPKVYERRDVELSGEQERMYAQMLSQATTELNGEHVSATVVIAQLLKLQQIVCGHVTSETGGVVRIPHKRTAALLSVLEECDGKVIIWANFRQSIKDICEALEKEYDPGSFVTYWGDTSDRDREKAVDLFQNNASTRFFVGNPQTGGYGLTLTAASTVVYYANSYDLEKRQQSEDRCHRIGQTKSVTYVDLVAPETVDEKILYALRAKIDLARVITGDGWREWIV